MITVLIASTILVGLIAIVMRCQLLDCKEGKHHFGAIVDDYYDWEVYCKTWCHRDCVFCGYQEKGLR